MFVRIYTGDDGQSHLQEMDPLNRAHTPDRH